MNKVERATRTWPRAGLSLLAADMTSCDRIVLARQVTMGYKSRAASYQGKVLVVSLSVCKDHDCPTEAQAKERSVLAVWQIKSMDCSENSSSTFNRVYQSNFTFSSCKNLFLRLNRHISDSGVFSY